MKGFKKKKKAKNFLTVLPVVLLVLLLAGCSLKKDSAAEAVGEADGPTEIHIDPNGEEGSGAAEEKTGSDEAAEAQTGADEAAEAETGSGETAQADAGSGETAQADTGTGETTASDSGVITDEAAVSAVQKYCYAQNPDLEEMVKSGEYPIYWDISDSNEKEAVVVYKSYTGCLNHYYVNRDTGETYVTEYVPGIMEEEQKTDESFNIRDYM